jgi:hypothetical protein
MAVCHLFERQRGCHRAYQLFSDNSHRTETDTHDYAACVSCKTPMRLSLLSPGMGTVYRAARRAGAPRHRPTLG